MRLKQHNQSYGVKLFGRKETMSIKTIIEEKISTMKSSEKKESQLLWFKIEEIISDSNEHLKLIIAQMKNYDIHDIKHSEKVLENAENILNKKILKLSFYELILLYSSCFLHDAAMALPFWEYDMLKAVEGNEFYYDKSISYSIKNDFKPVHSLANMVNFITSHKKDIFGSFDIVAQFVFAPPSEDDLILDLAKRMVEYENFRNGFAKGLKAKIENIPEYTNLSELIRCEFIRSTHHRRIFQYISNLYSTLSKIIGNIKALQFTKDLASICQSHGEPYEYVRKLHLSSSITPICIANIQFISTILRLADIIHFSSDRAPLSLFAEKKINDIESLKHWNAKFQNVKYEINEIHDRIMVSFSAFCSTPETYYFIQEYMDEIDSEISYYFSFYQNLEILNFPSKENYFICLEKEVNRSDVKSDPDKFIPENEVKITLNQSKIIKLLMGTQLYKDKFLFLRELYQNSLDACKLMLAQDINNNVSSSCKIEFGISVDKKGDTYIYCLDNGSGMTKDIVKNHLLNIGNSYYKSRNFIKENINLGGNIVPTSQFGIGILSCFMVSDRIEVITKNYNNREEVFSFSIDGPNERFFYLPVNALDKERLGVHGTLIKVFISEKIKKEINNEVPDTLQYYIYGRHSYNFSLNFTEKEKLERFANSLFYKLNSQIGIFNSNIKVIVRDNNDRVVSLINWTELFDYRKYTNISKEEIAKIWKYYVFLGNDSKELYLDAIKYREYIVDFPITVKDNGVELHTFLSLPLKGFSSTCDIRIFYFYGFLWNNSGFLIDGINIDENINNDMLDIFGDALARECIVNFVGEDRPVLSINRSSIISVSEKIKNILGKLLFKLVDEIAAITINHFEINNISTDSIEADMILSIIVNKYPKIASLIMDKFIAGNLGNLKIQDLNNNLAEKETTLSNIIQTKELKLVNIDFRKKTKITKELVLSKMFYASNVEVKDSDIFFSSEKRFPTISLYGFSNYNDLDRKSVV